MPNPQKPLSLPPLARKLSRTLAGKFGKGINENPSEHREVPPSWIPARCARPKTDAPSSKDVRSNGRADPGPNLRDSRSDNRRLDGGGRIAEQDREVSGDRTIV